MPYMGVIVRHSTVRSAMLGSRLSSPLRPGGQLMTQPQGCRPNERRGHPDHHLWCVPAAPQHVATLHLVRPAEAPTCPPDVLQMLGQMCPPHHLQVPRRRSCSRRPPTARRPPPQRRWTRARHLRRRPAAAGPAGRTSSPGRRWRQPWTGSPYPRGLDHARPGPQPFSA